jgi:predicted enzyme related to lactoylglutathione lyase
MFLGLRTVIYRVQNLEKAKLWYAEALGIQPSFDQPFYVGFNVGGFELGLDPASGSVSAGNNVIPYWGVDDIRKTLVHLQAIGTTLIADVQDVGGDILVATVEDPFGNLLGIIQNPQ